MDWMVFFATKNSVEGSLEGASLAGSVESFSIEGRTTFRAAEFR